MWYNAAILADSISPEGHRLTTFEVTFPQMVLRDMTRHRALSYSFESTRAVPIEKRIEQILCGDLYVPDFRLRAKGMGGGEETSVEEQVEARLKWTHQAISAALTAKSMAHLSKEHVGRMLEPYTWITGIISGTEWENYFALRCPPPGEKPDPKYPAQIELQIIAHMQEKLYRESTPEQLRHGQWHLPLVTDEEKRTPHKMDLPPFLAAGSAGRCAAVSYANHHKEGPLHLGVSRWKAKLAPSAHWSPGEHPAECVPEDTPNTGNFTGWKQLRKFYPHEAIRPREIQG